MIIVEKNFLNNNPFLHIVKKSGQQERLPFIIFTHGFTSAKENNLHYAYLLAEKGFRVILPEAIYHGEREQGLTERDLYGHFWEIVIKTIHELNSYKEYYVEEGLADPEKIGLAGTSMGGIVTLGALTKYKWVKAAVSLMGMPAYEEYLYWQLAQMKNLGVSLSFSDEQIQEQLSVIRQYDLSLQQNKLENRPLLFWHGKKDPIVPFELTYRFYQSVKGNYHTNPGNIHFITDEHADHKVSREGLKAMVEWFEKHLLQ